MCRCRKLTVSDSNANLALTTMLVIAHLVTVATDGRFKSGNVKKHIALKNCSLIMRS